MVRNPDMHSRFVVRDTNGELLGIFPGPLAQHAAAIKSLIVDHPGAHVKSAVTVENPCPQHQAFEVDNCPACGRSRRLGLT